MKKFSIVYEILGGRKQQNLFAETEEDVEYELSQIDPNFIPESRWVRVSSVEEIS